MCYSPLQLGKTHLISELCNELDGKKLILEPTVLLKKYIKSFNINIGNNTIIDTYQNLIRKTSDEISNMYGDIQYIFLDEVHRCGAQKWNKAINILLDTYKNAKIIGMSATPIRNDLNNIVDTIFDGIQLPPLYLGEAIKVGLLPNVCYVASLYAVSQDYNSLLEKIDKCKNIGLEEKSLLIEKLDRSFNDFKKIKNIPNILQKYLFKESYHLHNMKFIVFCKDIDEIEKNKKMVEEWFKDCYEDTGINKKIKFYDVHYKKKREDNERNISLFEEEHSDDTIDIIMSVNMFNEGYHLEDITGVILLRETKSNIVYFQQIGRVIGQSKFKGIIFDFVNNYNSIQTGYIKLFDEDALGKNCEENIKKWIDEAKDFVVNVHDEAKDIKEIIDEISEKCFDGNKPYTEDEIQYIKDNAHKGIMQLAKELNRNQCSVRNFCKKNGIEYFESRPYLSNEEKEYIEKNIKNKTMKQIAKDLGRAASAIRNYLIRSGIDYKTKKKVFSDEEINFIKNNSQTIPMKYIAQKLKTTPNTLKKFYEENNIPQYKKDLTPLSEEEIKYCLENKDEKYIKDIAQDLGRPPSTISKYFKENNIGHKVKTSFWTDEEKDYIAKNAKSKTVKEMSEYLKRSRASIRTYLYTYNIDYIKTCRTSLQEDEKEYIKKYSKTKILTEIAKDLGRTVGTIRRYYEENNIERFRNTQYSIDKEKEDYIILNANKCSAKEMAKVLGISAGTIRTYCNRHNIEYKKKNIPLTEEEKDFINNNIGEMNIKTISEKINKSQTTIKDYCKREGINYQWIYDR